MKLLVLDGNSIINRAFYGIRPLTTKDGFNTNAIYGFLNILSKLYTFVSPDAVVAAFDLKAPTFRHKMFDQYKAGRKPMPPELAEQMPVLKKLLDTAGVTVCEKEGFEADDILGTLAKTCSDSGNQCFIATGDRDSLQLVNENVSVLLAATKGGQPVLTVYDVNQIKDEFGISPVQLIDVKALQGDTSDNIPGVAGVGQKTALTLIQQYGSVENIYSDLDTLDIRDTLRAKLKAGEESAKMSYELGKICCEADVSTNLNFYTSKEKDEKELLSILVRLEFYKIIEKWGLDASSVTAEKNTIESQTEKQFILADQDFTLPESDTIYTLIDENKGNFNLYVCTEQSVVLYENVSAEKISQILSDVTVYTHDIKRICGFGIEINSKSFDAMLAAYLINPSASSYELTRLFAEYSVILPNVKDCPDSHTELATQVAGLPLLCHKLSSKLDQDGQTKLFEEIEMPLAFVLSDMEKEGFMVDAVGLSDFGKKLSSDIDKIQNDIYEITGYEFNLNSPKQLGEALFVKLELPPIKKTKSGFSTNAEVLEKLKDEHPVIPMILEYRTLTKLKSTYVDGLLAVIKEDGRIHSSFNQAETRTGRISSSEPNLQNIPVRRELGKELRCFFKAKDGCILIDADYSQIELRVLAHMADDKNMIDAFLSDEDIHTSTASKVFTIPKPLVTPLMRSRAKAVNFGIVYGIGPYSLANDLGISFGEAKKYIDGYMKTYSGVAQFMDNSVSKARECGFGCTLFGRRRPLHELTASNAIVRSAAERIARNMPIQGTAADIIKIAMINVSKALKEAGLKAKLILQVHDELIIESPAEEREAAEAILKNEMENAVKLKVPMTVDVCSGKTWFDTK